jgi:hypothetical protein
MKGEKLQMKVNILSSFAAGMLIATIISGTVYLSGDGNNSKSAVKTNGNQSSKKAQLSESDMIDKLAAAGYVVQSKAEFDKSIKEAKSSAQKNDSKEAKKTEPTVYRVVVNVSEGMTSIDVGNQLVNAKIIPNAFKFSQDIEKRGVENDLRPGSFAVDSSMSYDQIIGTIFKK